MRVKAGEKISTHCLVNAKTNLIIVAGDKEECLSCKQESIEFYKSCAAVYDSSIAAQTDKKILANLIACKNSMLEQAEEISSNWEVVEL